MDERECVGFGPLEIIFNSTWHDRRPKSTRTGGLVGTQISINFLNPLFGTFHGL